MKRTLAKPLGINYLWKSNSLSSSSSLSSYSLYRCPSRWPNLTQRGIKFPYEILLPQSCRVISDCVRNGLACWSRKKAAISRRWLAKSSAEAGNLQLCVQQANVIDKKSKREKRWKKRATPTYYRTLRKSESGARFRAFADCENLANVTTIGWFSSHYTDPVCLINEKDKKRPRVCTLVNVIYVVNVKWNIHRYMSLHTHIYIDS